MADVETDPEAWLARLLTQPRVRVAHRLGPDLLVEAELTRDRRPEPVPFVLGYNATGLDHAYAGASSVTVMGDSYLFLSDLRCSVQRARGHAGRSLRRHRPGPRREPELVFSAHKGVVSYAAAGDTAVAAVWLPPDTSSLDEPPVENHVTAQVLRGDLWPRSAHQFDGDVLRIARVPLDGDHPTLLPLHLEPDTMLTGALALSADTCAAGVVRFLTGGHRRYGQLLVPLSAPENATALWWEDDLVDLIAGPGGFAATAERVARPGRAPRQEAVLVAADGSQVVRAAPEHPDWLQPKAWDGDTLLCVGEQDGQRHLWRVRDGHATRVDLNGSVQSVTAGPLVVRSHIDLPPEVVSLSGDVVLAPAAATTPTGRRERLTYEAPDGSLWRGWLCLPAEETEHPLPVLVWCHGGPLLSWTDWSWRWNPWSFVAAGYAVLMPDPPLSVGYGQDAVERGWGRWTSDVAAVAAAQVRSALVDPRLDETRVATMGGSFGGYLALALATLLPEVRLVASHCGWADFAAVARACDLHWHWLREYGPVDDNPAYGRESLRLDHIAPGVKVLLSHGNEDTHVPVGESRAMYRTLETAGVDVELMVLPGERHSIRRPANVTAWHRWVLDACHTTLPTRKEPSPL